MTWTPRSGSSARTRRPDRSWQPWQPWRRPGAVCTAGGDGVFVKVLGREERSSDLLFRFYRWLRFRGLGDEAIASSLNQSIGQETLPGRMSTSARPSKRLTRPYRAWISTR